MAGRSAGRENLKKYGKPGKPGKHEKIGKPGKGAPNVTYTMVWVSAFAQTIVFATFGKPWVPKPLCM